MNLTAKSGGILEETNLLYNQQRGTNFLQLEDMTLPVQSGSVLKHKNQKVTQTTQSGCQSAIQSA